MKGEALETATPRPSTSNTGNNEARAVMAQITLVLRDGNTLDVPGKAGDNLMKLIRDGGGYELLALCGGGCSCATCHVYVDERYAHDLPAPNAEENDLLDCSGHRKPNSRLSCQIAFHDSMDGMRVEIAPEE
ncbi:2Fe-2S ferredoxin [Paraburkholderia unamae]|uniref:2Fe-2S ferredoxin n=2 Tax=Paraburkholderia unamae TaxID=219649 RepID=A0ABX5KUB1_9BURK|nr:2Fe-2S ferredoxin [Paraburkholderia unamae]CAG9271670.1 Dicamba O-demethylase, ferredoxin component [Paraburkholderia unamae]